ncbi:MAG: spermidine synthase [Gemmatimonadales bacterium]
MLVLAGIIFTLSGGAGLIYESVWSRYLALLVGHTAYAQVLVLAIFLGGMAVGSAVAAAYSDRLRDPLQLYAVAELAVGVVGFLFHPLFVAASELAYQMVFPALGPGTLLTAAKWVLAAALILPQAIVLGTTFPLVAAAIIRRIPRSPGRVLGLLYFTNNMGAAVGVLIGGFYLLASGGLPGTVRTAAGINVFVAIVALAMTRRFPAVPADTAQATTSTERPSQHPGTGRVRIRLRTLLLAVSFGTAVASFAYEIGWLRMLSLVLSSATHSFEIMLSAFIFGLAVGSFLIRSRADGFTDPLRALGIVQWVMGFTALSTLLLYAWSFEWTAWLMQAFEHNDAGYAGFSVGKYATSLAIMLPSTICAGMTLPLITRTLVVGEDGERAIGQVYSANTVGSVVGVAIAGLIILPWIGVRNLIVGGAALDMAIGAVLLIVAAPSARRRRLLGPAALAATAVVVTAMLVTPGVEREILSGGVFRYGTPRPPWLSQVRFYKDGRTATVSVYETSEPRRLVIATNGKADGSLPLSWLSTCKESTPREPLSGDASTQILAGLITLAHARQARHVAVIGHGTGMTAHYLLGDPDLEEVTTIEIEPAMVQGSVRFFPANARVFKDSRSHIVLEDARTYFAATDRKYDMVVSEPSNPWVSGVAGLFTTEFYRHIAQHLTDTGVFGQWISLYETDDDLVLSVLAAIHREFPTYSIFQTSAADMLIVASKAATPVEPDWSLFQLPAYAEEQCHMLPLTADDLESTRIANRSVFTPLLDDWDHPNSDFHPVLDLRAERVRFQSAQATGFLELTTEGFNLAAATTGHRMGPLKQTAPLAANIPRLIGRARAAVLREIDGSDRLRAAPDWGQLRTARYHHERWLELVGSDRPPSDWWTWLDHFRLLEADRSRGLAGVPDEKLYGEALEYIDRHGGPSSIRHAIGFERALATWDFPEAVSMLVAILNESSTAIWRPLDYTQWVPADLLIEGGVTAMLATGDTAGARNIYEAVSPKYDRPAKDLRRLLIESRLGGR